MLLCVFTHSLYQSNSYGSSYQFNADPDSNLLRYNFVQVLEVSRRSEHPLAGCKLLLLDRSGNIQSVYHPYKLITSSYYDIFASLPPIIPDGPVGILGLGAGTAARMIHQFWPHINLHGWELDASVVMVARQFFDMKELEEGKPPVNGRSAFELEEDASQLADEGSIITGTLRIF